MKTDRHEGNLLNLLISKILKAPACEEPKISIITPTWNTELSWFIELAISILQQTLTCWEWCIVDDCSTDTVFQEIFPQLASLPSVKIVKLSQNVGISQATNRGLLLAKSPFACCVDHDDLLVPDALELIVDKLEEGFDAVYSDSDKLNESGALGEPFYKPDWSPELLRGVMYVGHLLAFKREFAVLQGGFSSQYDRVQDFEFLLRFSEQTSKIGHVPKVLYHWRTSPGSVAADLNAKGDIGELQCAAVQAQLDRLGLRARAIPGPYPHRVRVEPACRIDYPLISVVIPTKDAPAILSKCLYSLFSKTTYPEFDVVCIDNDTTDPEALDEMAMAPVKRVILSGPFNFSRANNMALQFTRGEYLLFINNDVEVITPDWMERMLFYAEQEDVGAVGPLLLYPDGGIQHAGVILGPRGTADHVSRMAPVSDGYAGSLSCSHEVSAVTGACLMIRRRLFESVGGFNEHFFTHYQDLDLCLNLRKLGLRNIFLPSVRLYHHESLSRGSYYDLVDRNLLLDLWEPRIVSGDPYYNPHFDIESADYSLGRH